MLLQGRVHRFGRNIDTDVIIPAQYTFSADPELLGKHCMEGLDPTFSQKVHVGDAIVAEEAFGSGSSREQAPVAIKASGISCVVAKSFARIFYRNAINTGLPILICPEAVDVAREGSQIEVDLDAGTVAVDGRLFSAQRFPPFLQEVISRGGLMEYVKERVGQT
ncbi:MAG: 3-isopropylmalate dehydratase small subunit [Chloroflexota bacterium]